MLTLITLPISTNTYIIVMSRYIYTFSHISESDKRITDNVCFAAFYVSNLVYSPFGCDYYGNNNSEAIALFAIKFVDLRIFGC